MKRLALLTALCAASPIAAELNVVAKLDDPRVADRKVYLRHEWKGTDLVRCEAYLPKGDLPDEQSWELLFESAEVLRQATSICRHNANGSKLQIRGREVQTLRGRGLLVESIKSNW